MKHIILILILFTMPAIAQSSISTMPAGAGKLNVKDSTMFRELKVLVDNTQKQLEQLDKNIAEAQKQREQLFGALQAYYILFQKEKQKLNEINKINNK